MKNEKLYREAIKLAAPAEERFLAAIEANKSFSDDRALREKHHRMEVQPAAREVCAQQELIAALFGVSDERVHEDIHSLIAEQ